MAAGCDVADMRKMQKLLHREAEMFRRKGSQTLYVARLQLARSLGDAADEIERLRAIATVAGAIDALWQASEEKSVGWDNAMENLHALCKERFH